MKKSSRRKLIFRDQTNGDSGRKMQHFAGTEGKAQASAAHVETLSVDDKLK
jgi:hypothetical protein